MDAASATFLGVVHSGGRDGFTFAALDDEHKLLALTTGKPQDVLAFATGQSACVAAVNLPARPNQGVFRQLATQQQLFSNVVEEKWTDMRLAEYELRQQGVHIVATPSSVVDCPRWMQRGFTFFAQLQTLGYEPYPAEGAERQWLETNAEAGFWHLLGLKPFEARSLEGRLQRQLVLFERDLPVTDPLRFFEEVTRHKLLSGVLPLQGILSSAELDALLAAEVAWLARHHPDQLIKLGTPEEGEIYLIRGMSDHYAERKPFTKRK